jgi:outer membrane lipoprotein-sorting protein
VATGQKMRPKLLAGTFLMTVLAGAWIFLGISFLLPLASGRAQAGSSDDLDSVLKTLAAYCERLENAALDFVCLEQIKETVNPSLDENASPVALQDWAYLDRNNPRLRIRKVVQKIKNSYVYDYQCIRTRGEVRETRTLLEENGKKTNEPNAALKTSIVVYGNALLSPVGLFRARFQPQYEYKIVGREKVGGRPALILDAAPRPGAPESRNLYGKAWVDAKTYDILKIEWSEERIGRYEIFEKRGELYKMKPRLRLRSEFHAEKNGIRFPTSLFVEEAYLNSKGRAFIRSLTTVVYKNFKFFTVEVEVR